MRYVLLALLLAVAAPASATPVRWSALPEPGSVDLSLLLALETPYPDPAIVSLPIDDEPLTGLLEPFPGSLDPPEIVSVPEPTTILLCVYGLLIVAAMAKLRRR